MAWTIDPMKNQIFPTTISCFKHKTLAHNFYLTNLIGVLTPSVWKMHVGFECSDVYQI